MQSMVDVADVVLNAATTLEASKVNTYTKTADTMEVLCMCMIQYRGVSIDISSEESAVKRCLR